MDVPHIIIDGQSTDNTMSIISKYSKYIDIIVTSEEVGIEKPSTQMFYTILQKLNLNPCDVIMIGDNYDKDIIGAINANILGYWFHKNNPNFNNFIDLHSKFVSIWNELDKFKNLSKYCGERFEY